MEMGKRWLERKVEVRGDEKDSDGEERVREKERDKYI
jgi:zinc finger CCCH domain-containing protein 13